MIAQLLDVDVFNYTRPDLTDSKTKEVYEIKTIGTYAAGVVQLQKYIDDLNAADPTGNWHAGTSYRPPSPCLMFTKTFLQP
jgi:hypothetical protein